MLYVSLSKGTLQSSLSRLLYYFRVTIFHQVRLHEQYLQMIRDNLIVDDESEVFKDGNVKLVLRKNCDDSDRHSLSSKMEMCHIVWIMKLPTCLEESNHIISIPSH